MIESSLSEIIRTELQKESVLEIIPDKEGVFKIRNPVNLKELFHTPRHCLKYCLISSGSLYLWSSKEFTLETFPGHAFLLFFLISVVLLFIEMYLLVPPGMLLFAVTYLRQHNNLKMEVEKILKTMIVPAKL